MLHIIGGEKLGLRGRELGGWLYHAHNERVPSTVAQSGKYRIIFYQNLSVNRLVGSLETRLSPLVDGLGSCLNIESSKA